MSPLPEKRVRHRSHRDEITVDRIARALYARNPARPSSPVPGLPDNKYPYEHMFAFAQRTLAIRQAQDIYAMFQPYKPMWLSFSEPMFERCLRAGITEHSLEEIDQAIQSQVEAASDERGHYVDIDWGENWSEVEGRVLEALDISEGHYYAEEIG